MQFIETPLAGAFILELDKKDDERGYLARTFCREEFAARGLKTEIAQANLSFNAQKGTLRGMHYQEPPFAEAKLVQCLQGSIYDVIIDLRKDSGTCGQWLGLELEAGGRLLYVPEGFAHGFQTLEDRSLVNYLMFEFFAPQYARGVRWDDPAFGIKWPVPDPVISEKDRRWPDYER